MSTLFAASNYVNVMTITGSNVGVGTTAPLYPLHVVGSVYCSGTTYTSNLVVYGSNVVVIGQEIHSSNIIVANYGTGPGLVVNQYGTNIIAQFIDGESGTGLQVHNGAVVSIGDGTAPSGSDKLRVAGAMAITGNVGISGAGTTNPLSIVTSGNDTFTVKYDAALGAAWDGTRLTNQYGATELAAIKLCNESGSTGSLEFYTGAASVLNQRMRISSTGNVGIGTTNPTQTLSVNGVTAATRFLSTSLIWFKVISTGTAAYTAGAVKYTGAIVGTNTSWYSSATGRYTPQISGLYTFTFSALTSAQGNISILKNGSENIFLTSQVSGSWVGGSATVFMNGSTDYVYVNMVNGLFQNGVDWFSGYLVYTSSPAVFYDTPVFANGGGSVDLIYTSTLGLSGSSTGGTFTAANAGAPVNYISGTYTSDGTQFLAVSGLITTGSMPYVISVVANKLRVVNNDSGANHILFNFYQN
jgi:hypothetical protein